jgi:hypothetical protein
MARIKMKKLYVFLLNLAEIGLSQFFILNIYRYFLQIPIIKDFLNLELYRFLYNFAANPDLPASLINLEFIDF